MISAEILRCRIKDVDDVFTTPDLQMMASDPSFLPRFLDFWETIIGHVVANEDFLRDDEVVIRVVAGVGPKGLETRVQIYSEADFDDD